MPLEGDLVVLREEREGDIPLFVELRNNMNTQGWNQALPPDYTAAMERQRFDKREYSLDRKDARFVIERKSDGVAVGYINYTGLRPRWEATIGLITHEDAWGSQVAYDAQEVLLKFLFEDLGIRVVRLWSHCGNLRALRLAERSGFQMGIRPRESCYKRGEIVDLALMDMLREEYYARHPELEDHLPPL